MDSYTSQGDAGSLNAVREQVRLLEDAHRANGVSLSGRIVHVCHYLPVVPSLIARSSTPAPAGILSPPHTPPVIPGDVPPSPSDENQVQHDDQQQQPEQSRWKFSPRYGHAAMFSGIRSLSTTHDQLIVGWTGDITAVPSAGTPNSEDNIAPSGEHVPCTQVTQADRNALDAELVGYDEDGHGAAKEHKTEYVPVWLDDKVAHGHYDGYCKMSASLFIVASVFPYPSLFP